MKVLILCFDPMSMNSVLVLFSVSLLLSANCEHFLNHDFSDR